MEGDHEIDLDDLDGLFGEERVNLGGPNSTPVVWDCGESFPKLHFIVSSSSSTALMAHHVWQSSLILGKLLAKQSIPGVVIVPHKTTVVELGAGAAVPSIVCDVILNCRKVIATDYPDEKVLQAMEENSQRNGCKNLQVMGYAWGTSCENLFISIGGSVDILLAADTLWILKYHPLLVQSILNLMSMNTVLVLSYMHHDHDGETANKFFDAIDPFLQLEHESKHNWRKNQVSNMTKLEYGDVHIRVYRRKHI